MARAMKVAIVDDEADLRQSVSQWLALSGFDTETYATADIVEYDGVPSVKVGREFLLRSQRRVVGENGE